MSTSSPHASPEFGVAVFQLVHELENRWPGQLMPVVMSIHKGHDVPDSRLSSPPAAWPATPGEPLACSTTSGTNKLRTIRSLLCSASFTESVSRSEQACFGDPHLVQKMGVPQTPRCWWAQRCCAACKSRPSASPGTGHWAVVSSVTAAVVCRHMAFHGTGKAWMFYVHNSSLSQPQTNGSGSFQRC